MAPSPTQSQPSQPPRRPLPPIPRGATAQPMAVPRLAPINTALAQFPPLPDHPHTFPLSRPQEVELGFWLQNSDGVSAVEMGLREPSSAWGYAPGSGGRHTPWSTGTRLNRRNARRVSPTQPRFSAPPPEYSGPSHLGSAPMVRSESLPVLTYAELELVGGSRGWAQSWGRIAARSPSIHSPGGYVNDDLPTDPSPVARIPVDLRETEPPPPYTRFSGTPSPELSPSRDYDEAVYMRRTHTAPHVPHGGDNSDGGSPTTPTLATFSGRPRAPSSPTTPTGPTIRRHRSQCELDATPYARPTPARVLEQTLDADCGNTRFSRSRHTSPQPPQYPSYPAYPAYVLISPVPHAAPGSPSYLGVVSLERSTVPRLPPRWPHP